MYWLNILPVMYTENPEVLTEFNKLPYSKKVCFTTIKSNFDFAFYVEPKMFNLTELWQTINSIANGFINIFDLWDLLFYGKRTVLM